MTTCSWCGATVEEDDGFRAYEPAGARRAAFCRLEHAVPWAIQGARWEPAEPDDPPPPSGGDAACSWCSAPLAEVRVILVRHRGEHRVHDSFCGVDHLLSWAKAGGRWR